MKLPDTREIDVDRLVARVRRDLAASLLVTDDVEMMIAVIEEQRRLLAASAGDAA